MISILVRFSLLIGITICLVQGTSGADTENKEVLSAPINNAINKVEDGAVNFKVIKREAIPEGKAKRNGNNRKDSLKKRKKKINQRSKKGTKKNNVRKRNKSPKKGKRKNKQMRKKSKTGKQRNKQARRNGNKKDKKKNKPKNKRQWKNKQLRKKERENNNARRKNKGKAKGKGRNSGGKGKYRQIRECDPCAVIISDSFKIYRKYLNHERKIKRTRTWLTTITNKGKEIKRKPFEEDADWLAHVTNNGTDCPANNTAKNNAEVIETVAGLRECASATGPIAKFCNTSQITDVTVLQEKQDNCTKAATSSPPYTSYQGWIDGVTICFETTRTCKCYEDMNTVNNELPNIKPYSCQFPNNPPDWINEFGKATKDALDKCKAEVKACKVLERQACQLTSMCCANAADGGTMTTAASGRRMKIKASMIKQLHKMNIH